MYLRAGFGQVEGIALEGWTRLKKEVLIVSEQQPRYHMWFHNFLIYFALWAFSLFAVIYGVRFIFSGVEDGYHGFGLVMLVIVNALLVGLGLFTLWARFDLAAFRSRAPKELVAACVAGATLCLVNYWVEDIVGDDCNRTFLTNALILACWAIALHRYYKPRRDLFRNP